MQDFVKSFKNLIKCNEIRTDNTVFKLHYKFSVVLFIVFSILLSSKQYFGDPISCDTEEKTDIINIYCWITGTFILKENVNSALAYDNLDGLGNAGSATDTFTLLYYQWICLIFCIQALMFYLPRYLWKMWEGDRMSQLVRDLCGPFIPDHWSNKYKDKLRDFVLSRDNHNLFACRFAFCEILNLCNLALQFKFMDWYLDGHFFYYGYNVATTPWPKAMNELFPKRTKCTYSKVGPSGSLQRSDALCVLPLNILNEKFFLILWFWILFLFVFTIIALIYRFMFIFWRTFRVYLLMAQVRSLNRHKVRNVAEHLSFGQFFLLYTMGTKLNPFVYKELLLLIHEKIGLMGKIDNNLDMI